jgi:hypothetical protein
MKTQNAVLLSILVLIVSCTTKEKTSSTNFNAIGEKYVRLALRIGQYDSDFVDAYYGPDSLKPQGTIDTSVAFPKDSLLKAVNNLSAEVKQVLDDKNSSDSLKQRATWMSRQLTAFSRRIKIFGGEKSSFDQEALELFGVTPPKNSEEHFKQLLAQLDSVLPGTGTVEKRADELTKHFIIPKEKLDTVFKTAIAEARRLTKEKIELPGNEHFTMEYVTGKTWSGYNWYKGNYNSLIQINTDLPIYIERAIDLACHEGYPGHHVYNMLLEKNLYRDKGWVEVSLYPLFSPQSLIAEGSANYGIQVAFPGEAMKNYAKQVLMPLAGLDTTNADAYFTLLELKSKLNYARNEAARGFIDGTMTEADALKWLETYSLMTPAGAAKSLSFVKKYRSYVINYNYGLDLVKQHIEKNGGVESAPQKRWELFTKLLSNPVLPQDL